MSNLSNLVADPDHKIETIADANRKYLSNKRGHGVAIADLGDIGVDPKFAGNQSVCYVGTENHPLLPIINPNFTFDNIDFDRLLTATINREWTRQDHEPRRGILVMGPTGAGKTQYLRERFARQGIPMVNFTWQSDMDATDATYTREVIGSDTVYSDAAFLIAARNGLPVVIDEIDMAKPGQLVALNELFDTGKIVIPQTGETVIAERGFCVFATCNSSFFEDRSGDYAGARSQNKSVHSRFYKFEFGYASEEEEAAFILKQFPGMDENNAKAFAKFVTWVRKANDPMGQGLVAKGATQRISVPFSRRTVIDWLDLAESFSYLKDRMVSVPKYALKPVFTAALPDDERAMTEHLLDVATGITTDSSLA